MSRDDKIEVGFHDKKDKSIVDVNHRYNGGTYAGARDGYVHVSQKNGRKEPRRVCVYDNGGEAADRYTVTFPGVKGMSPYLGMSGAPFHPQGFCQRGERQDNQRIDVPGNSHLGRRIPFHELPEDCQKAVLQEYADYWELPYDWLLNDCILSDAQKREATGKKRKNSK
jgi:hypothetical protein